MSKYVIYYSTRKFMYRDLAHAWKSWADGEDLPESQIKGMSLFFRHIGKRFGLIKTFKEIGVIQ